MDTYQQVWADIVAAITQFRSESEPVWMVLAGLLVLLVGLLVATLGSYARRVRALHAEFKIAEDRSQDTKAHLQGQVGNLKSTMEELRRDYTLLQREGDEREQRFVILQQKNSSLEPPKILMLRVYPEIKVRGRVVAQREN